MNDFLLKVRQSVDHRTPLALAEHVTPLRHLEPLEEMLEPVRELVRGGKRLRAQLCAAGWLAAGGSADPMHSVLRHAGAALELFQGAALVHDDVIDAAHTRRGRPAAHRALASRHAAEGRRGDADTFGSSGAILLGDLLLATSSAEFELARSHLSANPAAAHRGREVFDQMCVEVAVGQYLDIRAQGMPWSRTDPAIPTGPAPTGDVVGGGARALRDDIASALLVVRHKSARYSVEHPLALGAALAGADRAREEGLRAVGLPLGEAFQLRDDELGVFGEPATTGKPAGDDLREGKRTVLLALTLAHLDAAGDGERAARVRGLVGRADLAPDEVGEIREIMHATGARAEHEDYVATRRDTGLRALAALEITDDARATLEALAHRLTARAA